MKIIDWKKKGNLVRFYLGKDTCNDYMGSDLNREGHIDIVFPFEYSVMEPREMDFYANSPFGKDDFKNKKSPIIVAIKDEEHSYGYWSKRQLLKAMDEGYIIYMNDSLKKLIEIQGEIKYE